jgi:hypothetical protein
MMLMWATPILRSSLLPALGGRTAATVTNDAIAASSAAGLALANDARSGGGGGGGGGKSRNDVFFEWQRARFERGETWALTDAHANGGAWPRWLRLVKAEVARYAQASGAAGKVRGGAPAIVAAPLFAWAAVAGGGNPSTNSSSSSSSGGWAGSVEGAAAGHLPHTHARAAVSGVYYARARGLRAGEGDLVLEDPRGALPPFGGRYRHRVREGDLVLFPGWLVHHVTPCCSGSGAERVAVAFNVEGQWEPTADLSVRMPLEDDTGA